MSEKTYLEVAGYIKENRSHGLMVWDPSELKFGDFVLTGMNSNGEMPIGYVTQIRKGCGAFGSDVYFIREHDETLNTHENNAYWILPDDQVEMIRPHFDYLPEKELEENPDLIYTIKGEREFGGFIVTEDNHKSDAMTTMTITITEGDVHE